MKDPVGARDTCAACGEAIKVVSSTGGRFAWADGHLMDPTVCFASSSLKHRPGGESAWARSS